MFNAALQGTGTPCICGAKQVNGPPWAVTPRITIQSVLYNISTFLSSVFFPILCFFLCFCVFFSFFPFSPSAFTNQPEFCAKRQNFRKRLTTSPICGIVYKVIDTVPLLMSGCGAVGSALPWGGRGRGFKSRHSDHLYVTKKITCQKSPIFRTFLRMWTLKFYSQNRGSPKAFFECFWDLNGRFFIFKRFESRFG